MPDRAQGPPPAPSEPTRAGVAITWMIGSVVALVIVIAASRGDVDRTAYGDGEIARYVATHLTTDPQDVHPVVSERGTSLRYGRIGLPALIWLLALGRNEAAPFAHALITVLAAGAAGAAASLLLPAHRLAPLVPFLAPGFALAVAGGYSEVLAVAAALWALVAARAERFGVAAALLAVALLARENAGGVLLAILIWDGIVRRVKTAFVVLAGLVPVAGWYVFVRSRFGHLPIFDPYLRETTDTLAAPVVAIVRSITSPPLGSAITAAVHLGLAVLAFALARRGRLGMAAALSGVQVLWAGPFAWRFAGDALRASVLVELLVLMVLLARRWETPRERARAAT